MAENNILPYDELKRETKLALIETSVKILSLKPDCIGAVKSNDELIDAVIDFSKAFYSRFPHIRGTTTIVPLRN